MSEEEVKELLKKGGVTLSSHDMGVLMQYKFCFPGEFRVTLYEDSIMIKWLSIKEM